MTSRRVDGVCCARCSRAAAKKKTFILRDGHAFCSRHFDRLPAHLRRSAIRADRTGADRKVLKALTEQAGDTNTPDRATNPPASPPEGGNRHMDGNRPTTITATTVTGGKDTP